MRAALAVLAAGVLVATLAGCAEEDKVKAGSGELTAPKLAIRVNCGAVKDYTDQNGVTWLADKVLEGEAKWGAVDGLTIERVGMTIEGTKLPGVYLFERYSMKGYQFTVPNGSYTVRLHFAETFDGVQQAGGRVFSVAINGKAVLKDFDVLEAAGGFAKPLVKGFEGVQITDGKLKIDFTAGAQNPEINGIEILAE